MVPITFETNKTNPVSNKLLENSWNFLICVSISMVLQAIKTGSNLAKNHNSTIQTFDDTSDKY